MCESVTLLRHFADIEAICAHAPCVVFVFAQRGCRNSVALCDIAAFATKGFGLIAAAVLAQTRAALRRTASRRLAACLHTLEQALPLLASGAGSAQNDSSVTGAYGDGSTQESTQTVSKKPPKTVTD